MLLEAVDVAHVMMERCLVYENQNEDSFAGVKIAMKFFLNGRPKIILILC